MPDNLRDQELIEAAEAAREAAVNHAELIVGFAAEAAAKGEGEEE